MRLLDNKPQQKAFFHISLMSVPLGNLNDLLVCCWVYTVCIHWNVLSALVGFFIIITIHIFTTSHLQCGYSVELVRNFLIKLFQQPWRFLKTIFLWEGTSFNKFLDSNFLRKPQNCQNVLFDIFRTKKKFSSSKWLFEV